MKSNFLKSVLVFIFVAAALAVISTSASAESGSSTQNTDVIAGSNTHALFFPLLNAKGNDDGNSESNTPTLDQFVQSVTNGQADVVRGVYVEGKIANYVVQQPANDPGYISSASKTATQFQTASAYSVIGLLAHNYAAGTHFSELVSGEVVAVVYGDGVVKRYQIDAIESYQALNPSDPYSDFINLDTGAQLTALDLFTHVYTSNNHLTFQTCIARDGKGSWGRLFVMASPID